MLTKKWAVQWGCFQVISWMKGDFENPDKLWPGNTLVMESLIFDNCWVPKERGQSSYKLFCNLLTCLGSNFNLQSLNIYESPASSGLSPHATIQSWQHYSPRGTLFLYILEQECPLLRCCFTCSPLSCEMIVRELCTLFFGQCKYTFVTVSCCCNARCGIICLSLFLRRHFDFSLMKCLPL